MVLQNWSLELLISISTAVFLRNQSSLILTYNLIFHAFSSFSQVICGERPCDGRPCATVPPTDHPWNFICPQPDGYFADPLNCIKYYHCSGNYGDHITCPTGQNEMNSGILSVLSSGILQEVEVYKSTTTPTTTGATTLSVSIVARGQSAIPMTKIAMT